MQERWKNLWRQPGIVPRSKVEFLNSGSPTHSQETISEVRWGTCLLWFLEVQHLFQCPETSHLLQEVAPRVCWPGTGHATSGPRWMAVRRRFLVIRRNSRQDSFVRKTSTGGEIHYSVMQISSYLNLWSPNMNKGNAIKKGKIEEQIPK